MKPRTEVKYLVITNSEIREFDEYREAWQFFLEKGERFAVQVYRLQRK